MTDLQIIELALRRAASQMPNHQSRAIRLIAGELEAMEQNALPMNEATLNTYRYNQNNLAE